MDEIQKVKLFDSNLLNFYKNKLSSEDYLLFKNAISKTNYKKIKLILKDVITEKCIQKHININDHLF